jgi:diaphanous 1
LIKIPRLQQRLECMLYRRRLELDIEEVQPDMLFMRAAASELKASPRFKRLLQLVLTVGNALNASSFRGGARGFRLDALNKVHTLSRLALSS